MKVLLFVQNEGEKRPTYIGRTGPLGEVPWTRCPAGLKASQAEYGLTSAQQDAVGFADRWWLVECADADHGRGIISHHEKHGEDAMLPDCLGGRVIAEGARHGA